MRISERRELAGSEIEGTVRKLGVGGREYRQVLGMHGWQELVIRLATAEAEESLPLDSESPNVKNQSFSFVQDLSSAEQFVREVNQNGFRPRIDPAQDPHFLKRELQKMRIAVLPKQSLMKHLKYAVLLDYERDRFFLIYAGGKWVQIETGVSTAEQPHRTKGHQPAQMRQLSRVKYRSDRYNQKKQKLFDSESEGDSPKDSRLINVKQHLLSLQRPADQATPSRLASETRRVNLRPEYSRVSPNRIKNSTIQAYPQKCIRCGGGTVPSQDYCYSCRAGLSPTALARRKSPAKASNQQRGLNGWLFEPSRNLDAYRGYGASPRASNRGRVFSQEKWRRFN